MPRFTRKVFVDLAIWMMAFGVAIGVAFPFFVMLLGTPPEVALRPVFVGACMAAGLLAGLVNFGLARGVVGARVRFLAGRMGMIEATLRTVTEDGDRSRCTPENCVVRVDSDDEFGQAAHAFNALIEALAASHRQQDTVSAFSELLGCHLELPLLTQAVLHELLKTLGAEAGAFLIEGDGERLVSASHGLLRVDDLLVSDHVARAVKTLADQSVVLPDDVVVEGLLAEFRPREVLALPVVYKGAALGVVVLASTRGFSAEARRLAGLFRHGLALALNNALAHDRLQRLAALDPLTGLYNRRFGLDRLAEEYGRARRVSGPLALIMFDIDHFKHVNDTYGHLAGDRVLTSVARVARGIVRQGDVLLRYGGEEFTAILPGAALCDAKLVAERLRRAVGETLVKEGDATIRVTISLGVVSCPELDVPSQQDLLRAADELLYKAKANGRDRVEVPA